jgi:hypothetical protein
MTDTRWVAGVGSAGIGRRESGSHIRGLHSFTFQLNSNLA